MAARALVLFAHGARDPRWAAPFERLRGIVQAQRPDVAVTLAYLELMTPQLPECVATLVRGGCRDVTVVPVFLGQGGHVLRDLPLLMADLATVYPDTSFKVVDAAGEDALVLEAIARYCLTSMDGG